jgi:hypothetical protein
MSYTRNIIIYIKLGTTNKVIEYAIALRIPYYIKKNRHVFSKLNLSVLHKIEFSGQDKLEMNLAELKNNTNKCRGRRRNLFSKPPLCLRTSLGPAADRLGAWGHRLSVQPAPCWWLRQGSTSR